jgi:hypothetical protein
MSSTTIAQTLSQIKQSIKKDHEIYQDDAQYQENVKFVRDEVVFLTIMTHSAGVNFESLDELERTIYINRTNRAIELMNMRNDLSEKPYLGDLKMFYEIAKDEISRDI